MTETVSKPMSWRAYLVVTLSFNLFLGLVAYLMAVLVKWGLFR